MENKCKLFKDSSQVSIIRLANRILLQMLVANSSGRGKNQLRRLKKRKHLSRKIQTKSRKLKLRSCLKKQIFRYKWPCLALCKRQALNNYIKKFLQVKPGNLNYAEMFLTTLKYLLKVCKCLAKSHLIITRKKRAVCIYLLR